MEPDGGQERAKWCQVLMELGATERQAKVAWLVHEGLEDKEIAKRLGTSVSTVKVEMRVLFAVLKVSKRKRHLLGVFAARVVDAAPAAAELAALPRAPIVPIPLPHLGLRGRRANRKARDRPGRNGRSPDSEGSEERPHEAPRA